MIGILYQIRLHHVCLRPGDRKGRHYISSRNQQDLILSVERSYPALGSRLCGTAWDGHHLWYADAGTDRLTCLDVHTGTVLQEVVCPETRTGLEFPCKLRYSPNYRDVNTAGVNPTTRAASVVILARLASPL
jgi:hypothetical protein